MCTTQICRVYPQQKITNFLSGTYLDRRNDGYISRFIAGTALYSALAAIYPVICVYLINGFLRDIDFVFEEVVNVTHPSVFKYPWSTET